MSQKHDVAVNDDEKFRVKIITDGESDKVTELRSEHATFAGNKQGLSVCWMRGASAFKRL